MQTDSITNAAELLNTAMTALADAEDAFGLNPTAPNAASAVPPRLHEEPR